VAIAAASQRLKCILCDDRTKPRGKSPLSEGVGADVVITPVSAKPGTLIICLDPAPIGRKLQIRFSQISIRIR